MSNATADRAAEMFTEAFGYARAYAYGKYVVTTGTGDGNFAYLASDVIDALEDVESPDYTDFCQNVEPLDGRRLALRIRDDFGFDIHRGGCCTPVLDA